MPACWNYSADNLIYNYTLYPFYAPFLPQERAEQLKMSMKGTYGGVIHAMTGIMASTVITPRYLRFCPKCVTEDKSSFGELYWHRLHQIPGVLVCPLHERLLLDSSVPVHGQNKHEFVPASEENCPNYNIRTGFDNKVFLKFIALTSDIRQLLDMKGINLEASELRYFYISKLMERGLATATGRVYQGELLNEFTNFFGTEFLEAVHSSVRCDDQNSWLASIVRKHRKSFHPVRHLLMIRFLGGSIEWLKGGTFIKKPFGIGPWPCLNAAAIHYLEPVVGDLNSSHCTETKRPVGTFTCSCGFIYSRRGPDQNPEDTFSVGRIKQFGIVWENALRQWVEQKNLSLRETARKLNVDPATVKKYADKLGLTPHWKCKKTELPKTVIVNNNQGKEDIKDKYRKTWCELQERFSRASKTELRKLAPGTYTWLYRHDREWLSQNSPCFKVNRQGKMRVDWLERDKEVLIKVRETINEIANLDDKPVRISISRVGKASGALSLLEKHIDKMPLTKDFLKGNIDNTEEYQIRRIKWAVNKINFAGELPKTWKVSRVSGLRPEFLNRLQPIIQFNINKCIDQGWVELVCLNSEIGPLDPENYLH